MPYLQIFFGFVLGFLSSIVTTLITDWQRRRKKRQGFMTSVYNELEQILAIVSLYSIHPDAEINKEKVVSYWQLRKEFGLKEKITPLVEEDLSAVKSAEAFFDSGKLDDFVNFHNLMSNNNSQRNVFNVPNKISTNFISSNMALISLMTPEDQSKLLNILRRINIINAKTGEIDSYFARIFDSAISEGNREALKINCRRVLQANSDFCYETAKEIADILRSWQYTKPEKSINLSKS